MAQGQDGAKATPGPTAGPPGPVSFGFSRTAPRKRLAEGREGPAGRRGGEEAAEAGEEKDFLRAVEGRELRSVRPPAERPRPRELVIPLLPRGRGAAPEDAVLRQAVQELLEESQKAPERRPAGAGAGAEAGEPSAAIPLLARARAEAEAAPCVGADYEAVPVEAYGLAMLRGMGWKPGEGIGRTFRQVVTPRENPLRPKGLGLGASLAPRPGPLPRGAPEGAAAEPEGLAPGRAVLVLAGPHRGLYGKVEGLDPDNARAVVRLAASGQAATLSEHVLSPVSRREYERGAQAGGPGQKAPKRRRPAPGPHWLRRDLRVRFVDKRHHEGRYYNTKMVVEDVPSPDTCVCRTDEGRLLEGLREHMLETLIPKEDRAAVMVVLGPHAGQLGRLLGRDQDRSRALVQLLQGEGEGAVLRLDLDAVCQYVGPVADD